MPGRSAALSEALVPSMSMVKPSFRAARAMAEKIRILQ